MADRFCIASGDFNSTSIWSTSSGGGSGASVPGAADVAIFDTGAFAVTTSQAHVVDGFKMLVGFTGSLITGDFAFEIENSEMLIDAGTLTLPATAKFTLDGVIQTGGTINWGGDTFFKGNSMTITLLPGSDSLNDVELNGATISGANPVIVLGKFILAAYNALNNTWKCEGDCDLLDTAASTSTGLIIFQGTNNQTLKGLVGGAILPGFQNDKTAGTLTIVDKILVRNSWLDNPTGTAITVYQDGSKIVSDNSGTVSSKFKFFDLEVSVVGTCTLDDIVCRGELLLQASNSLMGNATLEGNIKKVDATYSTASTAAITMKGDRVQTLEDAVGAKAPNGLFTMAGKSQKLITNSDWQDTSVNTPDAKFKLNSVLNLNGFDLTIEDVFDANGFLHDFAGGSVIAGTFNKNFGFQRGNANSLRNQTLKKRNQNLYSRTSNLGRRLMEGTSLLDFKSQIPSTPSEMLFGYIEGDFDQMNAATGDTWSAYDGDITKTRAQCAKSTANSPLETGQDFSWAHPGGLTLHSLDIWGSSDHGYISSGNPTDLKATFYGFDGSWNELGNTGEFTDGSTANPKTITSSDTTTLFTAWKVIFTFTGAFSSRLAEMRCFTAGSVQITVPNIDGDNITPGINATTGRSMSIVNGTLHEALLDCLLSSLVDTNDMVVEIKFDKPRPVDKAVCYSSNNGGFFNGSFPSDMQIDLELFDGSWATFGDTGLFTDAINLAKTINSSDNTTLFSALRIRISTASSQRKILSELKVHVFV